MHHEELLGHALGSSAVDMGVLFHYTSLPGLLGIVTSRTIWASDIRYLNDSLEYSLAAKIAREQLGGSYSFDKQLTGALEGLDQRDAFAVSLSENGDLLSQWRAYCEPGRGVSVGFDVTRLQQVTDAHDFVFMPAIYDPEVQVHLVRLVVGNAVAAYEERKLEREAIIDAFVDDMSLLARVLKHESFAEEREWRIISIHDRSDNLRPVATSVGRSSERIAVRDNGQRLVPYYSLPLPHEERTLGIESVIVGPTADPDLQTAAVRTLFGVSRLVCPQIVASKTSFRGW